MGYGNIFTHWAIYNRQYGNIFTHQAIYNRQYGNIFTHQAICNRKYGNIFTHWAINNKQWQYEPDKGNKIPKNTKIGGLKNEKYQTDKGNI